MAPFAADLLLALAGLGILVGCGLVPRRLNAVIPALGLCYLAGASVVPVVLIALLVIGIPFTLVTFFLVACACIVAGAVGPSGRPAERFTWSPEAWVIVAFVAIFGAFAIVGLLSALEMPLKEWDSWAIWGRKAQMLTAHNSLTSGFFASPSYYFMHADYPLQYPVWEAIHFRAAGGFDAQAVLRHVWLFLVAFVWAVAYLLRTQVRPLVWAPLLILAAAAPGFWQQLLSGNADVPLAIFVAMGAISLALWLGEGDGRPLALAAVMLAGAANLKNEGLMATVCLLAVAGAIGLPRGLRRKPFFFASLAVVLAALPWRIWTAAEGIEGDLPVSRGITDPAYLLGRTDRIWPSVQATVRELGNQSLWLYILPLAILVLTAALVSGRGRRAAAFYLGSIVLVWAGLIWSYWISPHPIEWHLATSVSRVVSLVLFIGIAALVHVSGILVSELDRGRRSGSTDAGHGLNDRSGSSDVALDEAAELA
ncbi:MAG TPA: hypothetical protein VFN85_01660 [Solirubrobacterales bacterium]|nr:hypothetical protein [Solirubrobacterales bacterium]